MFNKNLCIFDIESTGLSTTKDKIVQLGIKIFSPTGEILLNKSKLYNPGIPISADAKKTHGISDDDVKDELSFAEDARKLKKIFENKIIVGYNIFRFDLPLLAAEFERCGITIDFGKNIIDVLLLEKKLNTNDLSSVYERYTGNKLEGSHDALVDLTATFEILQCQIKKFKLDEETMYELSGSKNAVDYSGKLKKDEQGYLVFTFGKNKDHRVIDEKEYASWILKSDFPPQMKKLITEEINKYTIKKLPELNESFYPSKKRPTPTVFGDSEDLPF